MVLRGFGDLKERRNTREREKEIQDEFERVRIDHYLKLNRRIERRRKRIVDRLIRGEITGSSCCCCRRRRRLSIVVSLMFVLTSNLCFFIVWNFADC